MSEDKKNAPTVPAGFEMVSDGTLAEDHDFKKSPTLIGVIKSLKTVQVKRGKVFEDNRLMIIETDKGPISIWESANLQELFDDVVKGDGVYISYTGDVDLNNGLNPMKQFVTGIERTGKRDTPK